MGDENWPTARKYSEALPCTGTAAHSQEPARLPVNPLSPVVLRPALYIASTKSLLAAVCIPEEGTAQEDVANLCTVLLPPAHCAFVSTERVSEQGSGPSGSSTSTHAWQAAT